MNPLRQRRVVAMTGSGGVPHPGSDILQEDATFILQEDAASSIQTEG